MKIDKNKRKKMNIKVIVTTAVAITLIGIVSISIGKNSGANPFGNNGVLDAVSTIEHGVNKGISFFSGGFSDIINFKKNANEVEELKKEKKALEEEVVDLKGQLYEVNSLEGLKKSLNFVDEKYVANRVSAKIVSKNSGLWYTSVVISAGSKDGVKKNSLVINEDGLVGIINEVSSDYSKAITLLDTTSSVSFKLTKNPMYKGIIACGTDVEDEQSNRQKGLLQGYMFDSDYNVLPGDNIVTSGLGLYPENIAIGKVTKVIEDKSKSLKYVVVKPNVNFKQLDNVVIVEPRNIG